MQMLRKELVLLFFLLQANISSAIGLTHYNVMYLLTFLVLLCFAFSAKKKRQFYFVSFSLVALFLYRYSLNILSESIQTSIILAFPALFILVFPDDANNPRNLTFYKFLGKCVVVYVCLEFLFSYVEFVGHFSILGYTNSTYGIGSGPMTRATALSGSYLSNALIVSGFLFFVLCSNLKDKFKYPIWIAGFLSLMCFQGRIAMIVSLLYLCVYLFVHLKKNKSKFLNILFFIGMVFVVVSLAFFFGLGERLVNLGIFDENSSGVRSKMFEYILENYKLKDFIQGMSMKELTYVMLSMKVLIIECFFVIHLLLLGVFFVVLFYSQYVLIIKNLLCEYGFFFKTVAVSAFFLIAFINNSLASDYVPLSFFLLFAKIFSPSIFCKIVPSKYLNSPMRH